MHTVQHDILSVTITAGNYDKLVAQCLLWAANHEGRTVAFANVHVLMEAHDDPAFRTILHSTDLINPDGMPLVWALHALGAADASRVYGPHATLHLLRAAQRAGLPIGFYGGSEVALAKLVKQVQRDFPTLQIAYARSPPFRLLSDAEESAEIDEIRASGARLLFVGLGCPKQERWMSRHRNDLPLVQLGVGAAFDFLAGTKPQAPAWMMRTGTEWLFRLCSEPRRLFGRYIRHNPRFVVLFLKQLVQRRALRAPAST